MFSWATNQLEKLSQTVAPPPSSDNPVARFAYCCQRGDEQGAMELVGQMGRCSMTTVNDVKQYVPVHLACLHAMPNLTRLLMTQPGATVEVIDVDGNSCLHLASSSNKPAALDVVKILVGELDANVTAKNKQGQTPYDLAPLNTVRQYLLPIQLQKETRQALENGGKGLVPGMDLGGLRIQNSHLPPPPTMAGGAMMGGGPPPPPSVVMPRAQSGGAPATMQPSPQTQPVAGGGGAPPLPPAPQSGPAGYARTGSSSAAIYKRSGGRSFVQPDGFHSSSSDKKLQEKYGHSSYGSPAAGARFPPPPPSSGNSAHSLGGMGAGGVTTPPPHGAGGGANPFSAGATHLSGAGGRRPASRYVAIDPVTGQQQAMPGGPRSAPLPYTYSAPPTHNVFTPGAAPASQQQQQQQPPYASPAAAQQQQQQQQQAYAPPAAQQQHPPPAAQHSYPPQQYHHHHQQYHHHHHHQQPYQQAPAPVAVGAAPSSGGLTSPYLPPPPYQQPLQQQQPQAVHGVGTSMASPQQMQQPAPQASTPSPSTPHMFATPVAADTFSAHASTRSSMGSTASHASLLFAKPADGVSATNAFSSPPAASPTSGGAPTLNSVKSAEDLFGSPPPSAATSSSAAAATEPTRGLRGRTKSAEEIFAIPSTDGGEDSNELAAAPQPAEMPAAAMEATANAMEALAATANAVFGSGASATSASQSTATTAAESHPDSVPSFIPQASPFASSSTQRDVSALSIGSDLFTKSAGGSPAAASAFSSPSPAAADAFSNPAPAAAAAAEVAEPAPAPVQPNPSEVGAAAGELKADAPPPPEEDEMDDVPLSPRHPQLVKTPAMTETASAPPQDATNDPNGASLFSAIGMPPPPFSQK